MGLGQGAGPGMLWRCAKGRGQGTGVGRLTQTGCGSSIWRIPKLAATAEGAKAVDALAVGAQVSKHVALVHIWGDTQGSAALAALGHWGTPPPLCPPALPLGQGQPLLTLETPPFGCESYLCQRETQTELLPPHTEDTWRRGDTPSPQPHQGTHTNVEAQRLHMHCTPVTR